MRPLQGTPVKLTIWFKTNSEQEISIKTCEGYQNKGYVYSDRKIKGKGLQNVEINLPLVPKTLEILVSGNVVFELVDVQITPLKIAFFNETAETLGFFAHVLPIIQKLDSIVPGTYVDNAGKHPITISEVIRSRETKAVIVTPARVSRQSGQIELSKAKMQKYSISMRAFILCHERSHFELNSSNEIECDLNGLRWYLALGFPKIEAIYAATKVFNNQHPSAIQVERTEILLDYIKNYNQQTAQYDNGFC